MHSVQESVSGVRFVSTEASWIVPSAFCTYKEVFGSDVRFGFNQGQFWFQPRPVSSFKSRSCVVLRMVGLHDLVCCVMYKYVLDQYVLLLSLLLLLIPCMLIRKIHHFLSSMWYGLRKSNFN